MGVLATTYLGGQWMRYSLLDYCANFFLLIGSIFMLPFRFIRGTKINLSNLRQMPIKPVVRGVLLAIPVLIFFSVLLSAADVVFNQQIVNFFHRFDLGRIPEYILRLIIILFWAYVLMGVFLHAAQRSGDRKLIGEDKPVIKRFLGFTETSIVLGSVSILFLLFVIVQFRYFFGGEVNIGVEGYTRSEYARSGFSELIAVAFCSLLMILGLGTITRRESDQQKRIFSGLSVGIVALVIVILVSAYQRLNLAIDWHGFSRLRLYPRIFLVWIGILFVAVTVLEIIRRERYFALAMLLASLGFGVTISLVNVDASIVRHNVYRTIEGDYININYLTSLSTDAVPGLVKAYLDPVLPEETHNGVGAALACYLYPTSNKNYSPTDWRSFNYSHWAALKALDSVRTQLEQFVTHRIPGHLFVDTPDHKMQYECANSNLEQ